MDTILLWLTLGCEVAAALLAAASLARPAWGIWPPAHPRSASGLLMWVAFLGSAIGVVVLGVVDWGSLQLSWWVRGPLGAPLWVAGNGLALWSMAVLGLGPSFGDDGPLVCRGPYRLSRHPQYTAFIVGLVGWALITASDLTLVASSVAVIPLALAPLAEEQWLRKRHGANYEAYAETVPRFLGPSRSRAEP